jgi:hypothetical protein
MNRHKQRGCYGVELRYDVGAKAVAAARSTSDGFCRRASGWVNRLCTRTDVLKTDLRETRVQHAVSLLQL